MDETAQFECTVLAPPGEGLVAVEGEGGSPNAPLLKNGLRDLESPRRVTVDLAGVTIVDAQGLQRLLGCAQRLRKKHAAR